MKPGLVLRQRQSLVLAPQLIQALKMLQMPILQLEQTLRHELAINPLLEEIDELELAQESPEESEVDISETKTDQDKEKVDWDDYLQDDDEGYRVRDQREEEEDRLEGSASSAVSLYDYLMEQLAFLRWSEEEQQIGEYIIGNIRSDGYLAISVKEMAAELKVDASCIEHVLAMIQRFDPTGVGSRDLRESLLLQLKERGLEKSLAWRIVDEHIHDLEKKSIQQLAKMLGVPFDRTEKAMEVIKSLSPTPAHGRFDVGALSVTPDLVVERYGEEYIVFHNDKNVPRLRINSGYKNLIKRGNTSDSGTKDYVRQKLEQARWLLNAINQRRSTMIRVMEAIIAKQKEWFEKGEAFLKPLIMEEIANDVNMNVATISRVSSGKYVQTPLGVYEIKHFFNTGIAMEEGDDMSKRTVKQRIEELIAAEKSEIPLSDQEIFRMLNGEGIKLARRTVTKYREELGLKPARFRKRVGVPS